VRVRTLGIEMKGYGQLATRPGRFYKWAACPAKRDRGTVEVRPPPPLKSQPIDGRGLFRNPTLDKGRSLVGRAWCETGKCLPNTAERDRLYARIYPRAVQKKSCQLETQKTKWAGEQGAGDSHSDGACVVQRSCWLS